MKIFLVAFIAIFFSCLANASQVIFSDVTPYTITQQVLLEKTLRTYCATLFDGDHRARFTEVSTQISKQRVDQNMFDTIYTTVFHFETNESGWFEGTVTLQGAKDYQQDSIADFMLIADPNKNCLPN